MNEYERFKARRVMIRDYIKRSHFSNIPFEELNLQQESIRREGLIDLGEYQREKAWQDLKVKTKYAVLVPTALVGLKHFYSFPDKDISLLGIGRHRYFLFHSALALFALKLLYNQYTAWQENNPNFLNRPGRVVLGGLLGGASIGVGVHLLIDVFQPKAVIFPFFGSLVNGTLVDDRLWLLGNSMWCFKIAYDTFVIAFGKDQQRVTRYVEKEFVKPLGLEAGFYV